MIIGIVTITPAAASSSQCFSPPIDGLSMIAFSPSGRVNSGRSRRKISGRTRSVHEALSSNTNTTQRGSRQRKRDRPPHPKRVRAVDLCRVPEVARQRQEELAQQEDVERRREQVAGPERHERVV